MQALFEKRIYSKNPLAALICRKGNEGECDFPPFYTLTMCTSSDDAIFAML